MDDARKLLDSLMGQTRNLELKEAKKKKGNNFKEADSCKFYLLGFCPQHDQLFRNTKRHLGECNLIHSEALREEFEKHPEKEDYERKYVRDLVRYMEGIVRTADEAVSRQARNIQAANKDLEERGPNDVAKREIERIRENCNLLLSEAEELAEAGDVEGSKLKQAIFEQTKQKADDYEAKSKQPIKEEVCEICGLRPEDGDGMRKFSHTEGKIHIGFVKVREWLTKMRARQKELGADRKDADRKDRDRSRDRRRDKSGERAKDKDKEKDGDKEGEDSAKDKEGEDSAKAKDKEGEDSAKDKKEGDQEQSRDRRDRRDDRGRGNDDDRRGGDRRGGDRDYRGGDRRGGDRYDDDRRGGDRRGGDRGGRYRSRSRDRRRY